VAHEGEQVEISSQRCISNPATTVAHESDDIRIRLQAFDEFGQSSWQDEWAPCFSQTVRSCVKWFDPGDGAAMKQRCGIGLTVTSEKNLP